MPCPICSARAFYHTGAFWRCDRCAYMITDQALLMEESRDGTRVRTLSGPTRQLGRKRAAEAS
ncbi:hypothetical protein [Candidatus Nitrospira bockiana]